MQIETNVCAKRGVIIRFGDLQSGEETEAQRSYMSCPELGGIR